MYMSVGGFLNTATTSQSPTLEEAIGEILLPLLLAIYSFWLLIRAQRKARMALPPVTFPSQPEGGLRPSH
jgi:hypothetical protein